MFVQFSPFTPGPWTNMHERCKFLLGVLCVLSSLSVFFGFYRCFPSGRRKWKSSTEQKGGEMATGWAAVCWYHSGMWLVTDIPYHRCRAGQHRRCLEANEAKENGYHRIPIKEVDQEWMGSEMRDLHSFALGDAFWGFPSARFNHVCLISCWLYF